MQSILQVAKKIRELMADNENMDDLHECHDVFKREQDEQLVQWMNRLFLSTVIGLVCDALLLYCGRLHFLVIF